MGILRSRRYYGDHPGGVRMMTPNKVLHVGVTIFALAMILTIAVGCAVVLIHFVVKFW